MVRVVNTKNQPLSNITGPANLAIVVEAATNLASLVWQTVATNILPGSGSSPFTDSQSGNYGSRYCRFRSP